MIRITKLSSKERKEKIIRLNRIASIWQYEEAIKKALSSNNPAAGIVEVISNAQHENEITELSQAVVNVENQKDRKT